MWPADHVDHIVPARTAPELVYDLDNLQSLCHPCHSKKSVLERAGRYADYRRGVIIVRGET